MDVVPSCLVLLEAEAEEACWAARAWATACARLEVRSVPVWQARAAVAQAVPAQVAQALQEALHQLQSQRERL